MSADCAGVPCIGGVCGGGKSTAHPKSSNTTEGEGGQSPVDRYRALSFSLLSDAAGGFSVTTGNGSTVFDMGLGVSVRGVIQGLVIGAQLTGIVVNTSTAGGSSTVGFMEPGVQVGYAIALGDRFAVTPSGRALFLLPVSSGSTANGEFLGEIALEYFLGAHGFIEPYIAVGATDDFALGQAAFAFTAGYRLGVVF